jgi:hypothetical protein
MNVNGFVKRPLCPFCSKEWSDDMIDIEASASMACSTCASEVGGSVKIKCGGCNRLIYEKEFG